MRPDDSMAFKESVAAKDLSDVPLILSRQLKVQNELASWFGNYFENLNVLFTSNLSTNASIMISRELAYSLVVEGAIPFWDKSKIIYRPLSPELSATSVLARKCGQLYSLAATKFIQQVQCLLGMSKA